ncbi:MAG: MMPL family transporter, partial [Bacteroidetes bacterium]|nr:MMPL family transporter [Bacteroidota bacterium]
MTINSDILSSLPDGDTAASLYKTIGTQFGGNDMGMIVLETDDVFKAEVIQHIKQITDSIKYTNGVSTVTSLTNILDIKSSEWGIEIGKLVDEYDLPVEQSQLDSLKNYVFSKEMYRGAVVSEDGTATAIMFTLLPEGDKQAVAKEIKDKIEALDLPETTYFGGLPMMMNDINDLIVADMVWLIPIVFIVIAIILLLSFKSFRGVLLPLLTAGLAVIWTIGLMTVTGYELTIISNIIPVVLLAVGSAYTIHVLNSINHNKLADRKKALIQSLGYILVPVILAAVTTAIGFVSFVFGAYLTMIKDFGIFTAVGTLIALMLSVFFVPALISGLSMYSKKNVTENKEKQTILTHKILLPLVNFLFKHPKYTLTGWGVLLMLCIGG